MGNESNAASSAASSATPIAPATLPAKQVYAMAAIYLVVGLAIGYFFRGSQQPAPPAAITATSTGGAQPATQRAGAPQQAPRAGATANSGRMPSMQEMQQMADKKAAPLLDQLKKDPNNSALLGKVAALYLSAHQFKQAANYYGKVLDTDPKNVPVRTMLAVTLYSDGDVDGALNQLNTCLTYNPKDADSLFDLGMIRMQGKKDARGALAAWKQLLKTNPQLSADRKAVVQKKVDDIEAALAAHKGMEGAPGNDPHKTSPN
jgi:predicted Zn-dependent protease